MQNLLIPLATIAVLATPVFALAADPSPASRAAYEAACARCHDVGMMGAPVTDTPADWADRAAVDDAALQEHVNKGLLRGGVDDTARLGSEYMRIVTGAE